MLRHVRSRRSDSFGSIASNLTRRSSRNELYSSNTSDLDDEDDTVTLFEGENAVLSQFSAFTSLKNYDSPPSVKHRTSEQIVSEGVLRVYKILGKSAAFLQCGMFVHPILPKLRFWRTDLGEFILPQPNPGKYWRIELTGITDLADPTFENIQSLEHVLRESCNYMNIVPLEKFKTLEDVVDEVKKQELSKMNEKVLNDVPEFLYHNLSHSELTGSPDSFKNDTEKNFQVEVLSGPMDNISSLGDIPLLSPIDTPTTGMSTDISRTPSPVKEIKDISYQENNYNYNISMESISSSSTLDAILDTFDIPEKGSIGDRLEDQRSSNKVESSNSGSADGLVDGEEVVEMKEVQAINSHDVGAPDFQNTACEKNQELWTTNELEVSRIIPSPTLAEASISNKGHTTLAPRTKTEMFEKQIDLDFAYVAGRFSRESPIQNFTMHPLVPLAQRIKILSSAYPLKIRANDNDTILDEPTLSSFPAPSLERSISTRYFHTVTGDQFSRTHNVHVADRFDRMGSLKGNVFNSWRPTDLRDRETLLHTSGEILDATLQSFTKEQNEKSEKVALEPDIFQQAVVVSGYVGWRLFRRSIPGWVWR